MNRRQTVLVIDDDQEIVRWISAILQKLGLDVLCAIDGGEGLACAQRHRPDLILLDLSMPVLDGFGVCEHLRQHPRTGDIPIIFLTGSDDREGKVRAFGLGAVDYVTKPFHVDELQARVRAILRMQALVEALEIQASTDHLTGLPNRQAFHRRLTSCLQADSDGPERRFAVLFLDLDRFKIINDSMGHGIGDQLLMQVAERLQQSVQEPRPDVDGQNTDTVARMGGDEFAILLRDLPHAEAAVACAERIRSELAKPFMIGGYTFTAGVSIGIRIVDATTPGCADPDALLRDADNAMYHAKSNGKNQYALFDQAMHQRAVKRLQLEHDLFRALEENEFVLHYQPTYALEPGRLVGFECLVRWRPPSGELIYPGEFIEIAEECGLIVQLGRWVLHRACAQAVEWSKVYADQTFVMGVNVSKRQIIAPSFLEDIQGALSETGWPAERLCLEVTESIIMHDIETVLPIMRRLREMGVSLAMDDFGTGYSSLASLHRFPVNIVKVDRAFIEPMTSSRVYSAIVDAIINLTHNLNMTVVAEGVETEDQLVQLQTLDCDQVQGFLFSHPLSAEQVQILAEKDGGAALWWAPVGDMLRRHGKGEFRGVAAESTLQVSGRRFVTPSTTGLYGAGQR